MGKLLSAKLGWLFVDTDALLVSESGLSIKEIVEARGWAAFRNMEQTIVKQVCSLDRHVVATGGGVVLDEFNVNLMKKNGNIVWLKAVPDTIKARMMADQDTEAFRPSLTSKDSFSEIENTLAQREPFYQQAMDFCVNTDNKGLDAIAESILKYLKDGIRF